MRGREVNLSVFYMCFRITLIVKVYLKKELNAWNSRLFQNFCGLLWLGCRIYLFTFVRIRPGVYMGRRFIHNVAALRKKKMKINVAGKNVFKLNLYLECCQNLTHLNGWNGVSRRISLTNNSPFKQSNFSLSMIKALAHCKVQIMRVLLLKSLRGYKEQL